MIQEQCYTAGFSLTLSFFDTCNISYILHISLDLSLHVKFPYTDFYVPLFSIRAG